jgi:hypothetical protein
MSASPYHTIPLGLERNTGEARDDYTTKAYVTNDDRLPV